MMRPRNGVTLIEILVAAGILAALMLPMLNLFTNTTRRVGTEKHFLEASNLADEVLSQVESIHRRLGRLGTVPSQDHIGGRAPNGELDLETYSRAADSRDAGIVLLPARPADARGSAMYLTPTARGYRRFLTIAAVQAGEVRRNTLPDRLWLAHVRVEYDLTLDGKDITREVMLQSYFFEKCRIDEKFKAAAP